MPSTFDIQILIFKETDLEDGGSKKENPCEIIFSTAEVLSKKETIEVHTIGQQISPAWDNSNVSVNDFSKQFLKASESLASSIASELVCLKMSSKKKMIVILSNSDTIDEIRKLDLLLPTACFG